MNNPLRSAAGRTADCPPIERLAASPADPAIERHLQSCLHCRTELALLHEFESAEPEPEEQAGVQWIESELRRRTQTAPAGPTASGWARPMAWISSLFAPQNWKGLSLAAGSLLIVIGAAFYMNQDGALRRPTNAVLRSGGLRAISPTGEVAAEPGGEFRWEAAPGAASYRLTLMEVDQKVIWTFDTSATSARPPESIRAQLKPGRAFQWQVEAKNSAGESLGSTNLQFFHIFLTHR